MPSIQEQVDAKRKRVEELRAAVNARADAERVRIAESEAAVTLRRLEREEQRLMQELNEPVPEAPVAPADSAPVPPAPTPAPAKLEKE